MDQRPSGQSYGLLRGMGEKLLALVCESVPQEQLGAWLRVPLEHAAARGDFVCVEKLLAAGADPRVIRRSPGENSSLVVTASRSANDGGVLRSLRENGAKPDSECWESSAENEHGAGGGGGSSSSSSGDGGVGAKYVQDSSSESYGGSLCASLPYVEEDGNRWSPLHFAASAGHIASVRALVRAGADLDAADEEGEEGR